MNQCKKIKKLMNDALFSQLKEKDKKILDNHLQDCPECSQAYIESTQFLNFMNKREQPQMSEDFWDNYYSRLEEKMDAPTPRVKPTKTWQKWLDTITLDFQRKFIYGAVAAVILVIGIGLGHFFTVQQGSHRDNDTVSTIKRMFHNNIQGSNPALTQHFDNVQPLLTDLSNYSPEEDETDGDSVMVDKETVKKLLRENYLLKQVVARENNIPVTQVMDTLELILMELDNSNGDAMETRKSVQRLINDNSLLFKMNTITSTPSKRDYRKNSGKQTETI